MKAVKKKRPIPRNLGIQDNRVDDFQYILNSLLNNEKYKSSSKMQAENIQLDTDEELRILIPTHSHYWDNGYEDIDTEFKRGNYA